MKITKEQLKEIIAEELNEMERVPVPRDDPFGRDQTKEIKSHLRALKKIFDEVGLGNIPDEMKRGLSKIRTALDDIPGLSEGRFVSRSSFGDERRRSQQSSAADTLRRKIIRRPSGKKVSVEGYEGIFELETRQAAGGFRDVFAVNKETGQEVEVDINTVVVKQSSDRYGTASSLGTVKPVRQ